MNRLKAITDTFGGLNARNKGGEGEYISGLNLSTRNYPCLSPRMDREQIITMNKKQYAVYLRDQTGWREMDVRTYRDRQTRRIGQDWEKIWVEEGKSVYITFEGREGRTAAVFEINTAMDIEVTDRITGEGQCIGTVRMEPEYRIDSYQAESFFMFDDHMIWTKDGYLYDNGEQIGVVMRGEKQYAVVNTKLVIFPDKVIYDFTDRKLKKMDAGKMISVSSVAGNVVNISASYNSYTYDISTVENADGSVLESGTKLLKVFTSEYAALNDMDGTMVRLSSGAELFYVQLSGSDELGYRPMFYESADGETGIPEYDAVSNTKAGLIKNYRELTLEDGTVKKSVEILVYTSDAANVKQDDVVRVRFAPFLDKEVYGRIRSISDTAVEFTSPVIPSMKMFRIMDHYDTTGVSQYIVSWQNGTASEYYVTTLHGKSEGKCVFVLNTDNTWYIADNRGIVIESGTTARQGTSQGIVLRCTDAFSTESVTLERSIPDMDYICENNNRLWGVANAVQNVTKNEDGKEYTTTGRAIYSSALGDPTNFFDYSGLSTDSYAVAVASQGDFTGIIAYSDDLLCFKENEMFRITGDYPAQYYLYSYQMPGLKKGCSKSLIVIDERLYYCNEQGLYEYWSGYDSGRKLISYTIGDGPFEHAKCGTTDRRLYLQVDGHTYVYDIMQQIWHEEEDMKAVDFGRSGNRTYFAAPDGIYSVTGQNSTCEFRAEFHPFWEATMSRKNWRRITVRAEGSGDLQVFATAGENGKRLELERIDGADRWIRLQTVLPPNREDRLRIEIVGAGDITIRDIQREFIVMSEA